MMASCLLHPFRGLFSRDKKRPKTAYNNVYPSRQNVNPHHQPKAAPALNGVVRSTSVPYDAVSSTTDDAVLAADLLQNDNYEHGPLYQHTEELANRLRIDLAYQIRQKNLQGLFAGGSSPLGYRIFFKGLVGPTSVGVGVAICNGNGVLFFEMSKGFSGKGSELFAELKALVQGLALAVLLDLKRVSIFTDSASVFDYLVVENRGLSRNAATIRGQINLLLRKLSPLTVTVVDSNEIKLVTNLATYAIANNQGCSPFAKNRTVRCAICLVDMYVNQMFVNANCLHRYCFPCMSNHIQYRLYQGCLPNCPDENCKADLKLDSCKSFLTPGLFAMLSQRVKEASIPAWDKIYCPYPKCSTLLSKSNIVGPIKKCPECSGAFCIDCKVPWHSNLSCIDFKKLNPYPCKEDKVLMDLATKNLWRQCPRCSHMVSLAEGCFHIYCRCGHEFCYTCGKQWKNKRATCTCPVWEVRNFGNNQHQ